MTTDVVAKASGLDNNPWPGLAFYLEEQHGLFYGRETETAELLRLIQRETLTVLFGRSGLGKTSLLRAGLIPCLRSGTIFPILLRLDCSDRSATPSEQVKAETIRTAKDCGIDVEEKTAWRLDATLWEFFQATEFWGPRNDRLTPLLILDQFEEVFTIGHDSKRVTDFFEQLGDLVENRVPDVVHRRIEESTERLQIQSDGPNCKVLLSLREDFVAKLDSLRSILPSVMRNRFQLEALKGERALQVVAKPGHPWVDDKVAVEIVAAVAGRAGESLDAISKANVEPAYLNVMCHELFVRMTALGRAQITNDLVAKEKGEILEGLYERSLEGLPASLRLFVEDHLLTASGFRGTIPVSDAVAQGLALDDLKKLVDRRLLRFENRLGTPHVELSHDLLTRVVQKSRDERRAREARAEEERKQEALRRALRHSRLHAVAIAGIAVSIVLCWWILYVRPTAFYYRDFTKRFGSIEGFGHLKQEATRHRQTSLRVTKKGCLGKVLTMEAVDSAGRLTLNNNVGTYLNSASTSQSQKACRWEFVYDEPPRYGELYGKQGNVVYETARDERGRIVRGFMYAPLDTASKTPPSTRKATWVGPDGLPMPQRNSHAEIVEFLYDKQGYEIRRRFLDWDGHPAPGPDEAFGKAFEYDSAGRQIKETSLDADGKPMNDTAGNAAMSMQYDSKGNLTDATAYDANGHPTLLTKDGWCKAHLSYDNWGNRTETRYFDEKGAPVIDREEGANMVRVIYDERGNETDASYFDINLKPMDRLGDFGYQRIHSVYDPDSNKQQQVSYFNSSGKPATGPQGWHEVRESYDANGFLSQWACYDEYRKPVNSSDGYHLVRLKNDAMGNELQAAFFGVDLKPAITKKGQYHLRISHYDERGRLTDSSYYSDDNGTPCVNSRDGSHKYTQTFDRFGNVVAIEYFDNDGKPVLVSSRYHRQEFQYNDFGKITEIRSYDKAGLPIADKFGVHKKTYAYDRRGLLLLAASYGLSGQLVGDEQGIALARYKYNDKRQFILKDYFGVKGPAKGPEGAHRIVAEYDDVGRQIRLRNFDVSLHETIESGTTLTRERYDSRGREIETSYHNDRGSLRVNEDGYAIVRYELDKNGNRLVTRYLNENERPVIKRGSCAIIRNKYDDHDRETKESYFDPNDVPMISPETGVAGQEFQYDSLGKMIGFADFDVNDKPMEEPSGYARLQVVNDSTGKRLETDYYDRFNVLILQRTQSGAFIPSRASRAFLNSLPAPTMPIVARLTGGLDGIAKRAGLHVGDVLLDYQGKSFDPQTKESVERWLALFETGPNSPRTLGILRNGKRVVVHVPKGSLDVTLEPVLTKK